MKPREARHQVLANSRIRCGAAWSDARILNLSSRGLGLYAEAPPVEGAYIEIKRGRHVIVARVRWVSGLRFGVHTQDAVPVDAMMSNPRSSDACSPSESAAEHIVERRSAVRPLKFQHEKNRMIARVVEFAFISILATSAAFAGMGVIKDAIGRPIAEAQFALGAK